MGRQLGRLRLDQHGAARCDHQGQPLSVGAGRRQQAPSLGLVGGVPAVRHLVAGQELPHARGTRRPAVPDHLGGGYRPVVAGAPGREQIVQDRVELLLRRVPGLEQVVVEVDDVDRVDRRAGVGVRGQQHAPRARVHAEGLLEELDAVHLRHAVVGEDHRHQVAPQLQLAQRLQCGLAGLGAHDPVPGAVVAPQVTGDGPGDPRVVVHGQDDGPRCVGGLCHTSPPRVLWAGSPARRPRRFPPIVCSIVRDRPGTPRDPREPPGRRGRALRVPARSLLVSGKSSPP